MFTIKTTKDKHAGENVKKREHFYTVGGNVNSTDSMENSMECPQEKLETELPHDLAISLLAVYLKKMKSLSCRDSCTLKFIASLFTIVQVQKQPKCLLVNEWIVKM